MGMTLQYFHTISTFCSILPATMHTTKLSTCTLAYSHPLNESITTHQQGTQLCSPDSTLQHIWQPMPCSVAIKLQPPTTTHSPYMSTCTTHSVLPTPLPSTTLLCTQQIQGIVSKMAQDVGMVWKYCGVIPILFSWVLRVPYLHALVFIKTFNSGLLLWSTVCIPFSMTLYVKMNVAQSYEN